MINTNNPIKYFIIVLFVLSIDCISTNYSHAGNSNSTINAQNAHNNNESLNNKSNEKASYSNGKEDVFITQFSNMFMIRIGLAVPQANYAITKTDRVIEFYPNSNKIFNAELSYNDYGISGSYSLSESSLDEKKYGHTEYRDIQCYYWKDNYGADAIYQKYDGYYKGQSNPDPKRPDLLIEYSLLNVYYIFFPEWFSFKAAFHQSEKQTKSGGTFLVMASMSYLDVSADYPLIPSNDFKDFGEAVGFQGGKYWGLTLSAGGMGTLVFFSDFFLTLGGFLGYGITKYDYSTDFGDNSGNRGLAKLNIRFSSGYNGERFFSAIILVADLQNYRLIQTNMQFMTGYIGIYFGTRI